MTRPAPSVYMNLSLLWYEITLDHCLVGRSVKQMDTMGVRHVSGKENQKKGLKSP